MSEVQQDSQDSGKGKHKKVRAKKSSTHIDMTPMVDLAFLLLTFFMLTTTFSKPKAMDLTMPDKKKKDDPPDSMIVKNAITFLLGDKDRVFYYYGELKPETQLEEANYSEGIRKVLLDYNKEAYDSVNILRALVLKGQMPDTVFNRRRVEITGKRSALFAIIKTDDKAKYGNVINVLDDCNITSVGKFALVDITPPELELLQKKYVN
jgi:biopolymer transport protein ExbD